MQAPAPRPRPSRLATLAPQGEELSRQLAAVGIICSPSQAYFLVMAGLNPAIHDLTRDEFE